MRQSLREAGATEEQSEKHEKKWRVAEAECGALRAELDAALRETELEKEARVVLEDKLAEGRAEVAAAVSEAETMRAEWEEERTAVQQTMELAELRLKEQASALSAVAAVSPAASSALQRLGSPAPAPQEQRQQHPVPTSPARPHAAPPATASASKQQPTQPATEPRTPQRRSGSAHPTPRRSGALIAPAEELPPPRQGRRGSQQRTGTGTGKKAKARARGKENREKAPREKAVDYAKQVEERDAMLRQITEVAGREFVTRNGLATAPIGRVAEGLNSGRLEALAHVRATAGKQVAHALAFAPVEEIERATLSMLGTPAQPAALGRAAGAEGTRLSFRQATSRHETV